MSILAKRSVSMSQRPTKRALACEATSLMSPYPLPSTPMAAIWTCELRLRARTTAGKAIVANAAVRRKFRRDRVMAGWGEQIEPTPPPLGNPPI